MSAKTYNSFLLLLVLLTIPLVTSSQTSAQSNKNPWAADKDMLLYFEAVAKIRENALNQPTGQEIVRESLKTYLRTTDPHADYLSPEEYTGFKESQKSNYVGLGMEIERNSSGQIVCIPYPGGPAERSGVKFGDILISVNGKKISGKSLFAIVSIARGQEGTKVVLTVRNKKGVQKKIRVKRTSVRSESVVKRRIDKIPVIKILSFTKNTQRELKYALADLNKKKPIIFDLRENPGGDLHSAIDSAMLVLEKDKKIVDIKKSSRTKSYKSLGNTVNSISPLYLWQDDKTASAAEVFIAALTQNGRAISIGKTTYGKGTEQDIIELSDGSAIILTTGYLETPDGTRYNGKGIVPAYTIKTDSPKTDHYLSKVKELIRQKVSAKPPSPGKPEEKEDKTLPAQKQSQETDTPTPPQDNHFICFDRNFDTENDAEIWTSVLRKSFNKLDEQYLLQRNTPEGVKFIVCMGPYKSAGEADEKHKKISEAINVSMFTQSFKNGDFNII